MGKRKAGTGTRKQMSVYPPDRTGVTLAGYTSVFFTQAIRCWAKMMEAAAVEMETAFSAAEWNYMAAACQEVVWDFDPERDRPGEAVAERVERGARYEVRSDILDPKKAQTLGKKLRDLDYLHAWAVIWALQWGEKNQDTIGEADQWWKLAHRQKILGGE